jgi:flagellar hook-length control protein FliK
VRLQDAVGAVQATFTAANQAGVSSARITLSPASLGGITISLSQTQDGLVARVTADHPEAAQTLAQSAGDLKRSLEQSGLSLLRLDIGSTGQQSLASFTGGGGGQSAGNGQTHSQAAADLADDEHEPATETATTSSSGALVDVLA